MEIVRFLVEQIERVPATFWVGVLTLGGALIVMWRTNAQHTSRLRIQLFAEAERLSRQLEHATAEKREDRAADLKRETYFEALTELTVANSIIGAVVDRVEGDGLTRVLDPLTKSLARVALVAEQSARDLSRQLSVSYVRTLILAVEARQPVQVARLDKELAEKKMSLLRQEREQVIARHLAAIDEAIRQRVSLPDWQTKSHDERVAALTIELEAAVAAVRQAMKAYSDATIGALKSIREATTAIAPVVIAFEEALRSELRDGAVRRAHGPVISAAAKDSENDAPFLENWPTRPGAEP